MKNFWTKNELEVYLNYCKLNNLKYECVWVNMEDVEREKALLIIHKQMLKIDKPVKFYLNSEYLKTVRYSLISFIKEEFPNNLITWIPDNFKTKQDVVEYLELHVQKEMQFN